MAAWPSPPSRSSPIARPIWSSSLIKVADGSLRTYYLATGIEGNRSFPIELAQIGAAVMQRDDAGTVRPLATRQRTLLLLPRGALGVSDTVWAQLKKLDAQRLRDRLEREIREAIAGLPQEVVMIRQEDSVAYKALQAADYVAWAIFQKYEHGEQRFCDIIAEQIIVEGIVQRSLW
jgi:hypothetical protein